MNYTKIMALAVVLCFAAGAFAVIGADDSEAVTAGSTNVYIYDGSDWADYPGMSGYNALQALQATGKSVVANTDYILVQSNDWGSYTEINADYGKITSIGGVSPSGDNVWNVFVYNNGWSAGIEAIGFITPFSDGAAPSANVVFWYGEETDIVPTAVTNHVTSFASLITPSGNDYRYTFELKVSADDYSPTIAAGTAVITPTGTISLTGENLTSGITVIGYGSNAYAALKNAVGASNISANESAGAYYGWINTLFGLGTVSSGSDYIYWTQYTDSGSFLNYNLGSYSTLENVPSDNTLNENFVQSAFSMEYVLYSYS